MHLRLSGLLLLVAALFTVVALLLLTPLALASPLSTLASSASTVAAAPAADRPDWLAGPPGGGRTRAKVNPGAP